MRTRFRDRRAIREAFQLLSGEKPLFEAYAGDGQGNVKVPDGLPDQVFVRSVRGGAPVVVYNWQASVREGDRVLIGEDGYNKGLRQILRIKRYPGVDYSGSAEILEHAGNHYLDGSDPAWIDTRQITNLLAVPSGLTVVIYPGFVIVDNQIVWVPRTELDLTSYVPGSGAKWLLIKTADGTLEVQEGSALDSFADLQNTNLPEIEASHVAPWAVKMYYGQTKISNATTAPDLVDLRFAPRSGGGGGGGVSFNDSEGDPEDVDSTAAADGTSEYAARRDHRHQGHDPVTLADGSPGSLSGQELDLSSLGSIKLSDIETYQRFIIGAHRGDISPADGYPENTLYAMISAILKGAQRLELDVRKNADGTWYLMHDADVARTTNGSGNVSSKTDAQMDALTIDGGYGYVSARHAGLYHPPSLEAVLAAVAPYDVTIQVDNKDEADSAGLAAFLVAQGWAHRVAINAYSQSEAQAIKGVNPNIIVVGDLAWSESDATTKTVGTYELEDVLGDAPRQIYMDDPLTNYDSTDQAQLTRQAYVAGARVYVSWDLIASMEEYRKILALDEHLTASNPHNQYQQTTEKGEANGYAELGAGGLVPTNQLGTGTPTSATYLRGDQAWTVVDAGAWSPLTNGDPDSPELIFMDGDVVIMKEI